MRNLFQLTLHATPDFRSCCRGLLTRYKGNFQLAQQTFYQDHLFHSYYQHSFVVMMLVDSSALPEVSVALINNIVDILNSAVNFLNNIVDILNNICVLADSAQVARSVSGGLAVLSLSPI